MFSASWMVGGTGALPDGYIVVIVRHQAAASVKRQCFALVPAICDRIGMLAIKYTNTDKNVNLLMVAFPAIRKLGLTDQ
jgi:hypothetical protein